MKKFLFIVNPIAGGGKGLAAATRVSSVIGKNYCEIISTKKQGDATKIARQHAAHFENVIAVGGDGTLNEVAQGILHENVKLGILPAGSGNALALSLKYPTSLDEIAQVFLSQKTKLIDVGKVNSHIFLNTFGIGFDAHVANIFQKSKRGLWSYIQIALKEMPFYKSFPIIINDEKYQAVLVNVTNSGQFGNNFYISKSSKIDDGILELCIIQKFSVPDIALHGFSFLQKGIQSSSQAINKRGTRFLIKSPALLPAHCDGEPFKDKHFEINVLPKSLQILIP